MANFTGKVMANKGNKQLSQDDAPYRIGSHDYTHTSGGCVCIQCKPNVTVGGSGVDMHGIEVSPRFADGIAGRDIVGFKSNPDMKGTTGNLTGAMRCYEGKLETSTTCTRTIAVMAVLHAMSNVRGTQTKGPTVILVSAAEYNGWESVIELESTQALTWDDDPATEPSTAAGYFKVIVNDQVRYVQLYSGAPTD